jgi:hypothetical protein
LGKLATFVSPALFDVVPARQIWTRSRTLLAQSRDGVLIRRATADRAALLAKTMPQVRLAMHADQGAPHAPSDASSNHWRGAQIAELYFRQLFSDGPCLLDLRATAFSSRGQTLLWSPASWVTEWSRDFIEPLREIYSGFYGHDDARFRRGLAALSLTHSEDLFREQFGENQAEVLFQVQSFIDVFHRVFVRCKRAGTKLHPDFIPLGIYLAALYDHEQELHAKVDVARAFADATCQGTTYQSAGLP